MSRVRLCDNCVVMIVLSRRNFLAAAVAASVPASARSLTDIGVQLYTVRKVLPKDPLGVLRQVQEIGYQEVEVIPDQLDITMAALKQTNLKAISLHLDTDSSFEAGQVGSRRSTMRRRSGSSTSCVPR